MTPVGDDIASLGGVSADDQWEAQYQIALDELIRQIRSGVTRRIEREGVPPFDDHLIPVPPNFVGRNEDLHWVLSRLWPGSPDAIAAINGLGGVGKTALAAVTVRNAMRDRRFPAGIAVVDCQNQTDPAIILRRVLGRFDPRREEPGDPPGA